MWSASSMYWSISIHAPRTGSDYSEKNVMGWFEFQSTLPARGATIEYY